MNNTAYRTTARTRLQTALAALAILLAGAFATGLAQDSEPQQGGTIVVAIPGEPPMLDVQMTTAHVTGQIGAHVIEKLVEPNADGVPQPHLAEEVTVNDDATRFTFKLREGVLFHNGEEMQADDVVASLERWFRVSSRAQSAAAILESVTAIDDYTVEIQLSEPMSPFLPLLANYSPASGIYPKEIVEEYADGPIQEHIGTGPYRFVEWLPDRYVRLERFEEYQPVDAPGSGLAGERIAYADEIRFVPVPDDSTRLAGVQTGEFDFGTSVPADTYPLLQADDRVQTFILEGESKLRLWLNHNESSLLTNRLINQAVLAALDMEELLTAAMGPAEFWDFSHQPVLRDTPFHVESGIEYYDQRDPERARQLLEEAGYDGQPIRWLTSPDYSYNYSASLAGADQLREAGFEVDLQVLEWATYQERRNSGENWELAATGGGMITEPAIFPPSRYGTWWTEDEPIEQLTRQMNSTADQQERIELYSQIRELSLAAGGGPSIEIGEMHGLSIGSARLQGFTPYRPDVFWNVWLDDSLR